jgi:DNA-binding response OmpR family regulator
MSSSSRTTAFGASAGSGPHILVIEDEPAVQTLLRKQLTANGYQVTVAADGLDGLMKLETIRPDLVISDVMMPNLDGIEFVRAIKQHQETQRIPVIFLTAKSDPRSMIEGINVGARFYVTKPFQIDDLLSKVKRALGGK